MRLSIGLSPLCLVCSAILISSLCLETGGQEWTRFRGPNGTGVSNAESIPTNWSEDDYAWRAELPGIGHSSPVVWGDRLFLMSADPDSAKRYLLCFRTTDGKQLWVREFDSATHKLHTRSSYASSTPTVDEERVYFGWSTPEETTLIALDHEGGEVWKQDLGRWVSQHGFGTSPIVYQDMLILHNSQQSNQLPEGVEPGKSAMMAFNRRTGEQIWSTPLKSANVCYSVPFIYEPESGKPELVCTSTGNGLFSLDPATGARNWALEGCFSMRTVSSPVLSGGHIFGSTGSGRYSSNYVIAVKPGSQTRQPELAYELKNSNKFKAPYVPCAITKGDSVFLLYDRGYAACVDAPTGKIRWFEARTGANFSGSPIRIGERIFAIDEEGVVWVIAADETEYRVLAENSLGEASRSTPAVSGGRLFLRTYSQLFCIAGKGA